MVIDVLDIYIKTYIFNFFVCLSISLFCLISETAEPILTGPSLVDS